MCVQSLVRNCHHSQILSEQLFHLVAFDCPDVVVAAAAGSFLVLVLAGIAVQASQEEQRSLSIAFLVAADAVALV